MVHSSQTEAQEWRLIPIEKDKNVFEIEFAGQEYGQNGWKLYVPIEKENEVRYRVLLSKQFSSKWILVPKDNLFEIQEVISKMVLTAHNDTFIRDSASVFAYVTSPGMSGDVWSFNSYANRNNLNIRPRILLDRQLKLTNRIQRKYS